MSALPVAHPESKQRGSRKKALRTMARLLEEQMDEMGLSEEEKNAKIRAFAERVDKAKAKAARAEFRPK